MTRRLFLAVYVRVASWLVLVGNDVSLLGCCELVLGVVGLDVAPHRGDSSWKGNRCRNGWSVGPDRCSVLRSPVFVR